MNSASRLLVIMGCKARGAGLLCCLMLFAASSAIAGNTVNGAKIYNLQCKKCHGASGKSVLPGVADFSRGEGLMKADGELFLKIKSGSGMMPAYRGVLKDDDIFDVISYLRKLRR